MKAYGNVIELHSFLTSETDEIDWSASHTVLFNLKETGSASPWIKGWVDCRSACNLWRKEKFLAPGRNRTTSKQ
jgi:hypothetical protein